jgi:hypothetical protein
MVADMRIQALHVCGYIALSRLGRQWPFWERTCTALRRTDGQQSRRHARLQEGAAAAQARLECTVLLSAQSVLSWFA